MLMYKTLMKTKNALLNAVKTAKAPVRVKKVLFVLAKMFNFQQAYHFWQYNGYKEEGFQYLIIDGIKKEAVKKLPNTDADEIEQLITDIVFAGIPA